MINLIALRVARVKMGISQIEVARRVGITQSYYNRIERGKLNGSIKTIQAICKVLGISVNEVLE